MTYNRHPHEKIKRYENNEKVRNFDEYDTFDSRGLLYKEESVKHVPVVEVREEKTGFTHYPMPMYLFHDNKAFSGPVEEKRVARAYKKGGDIEQIQPIYIYENKKKTTKIVEPIQSHSRPIKEIEKDELTNTAMPMYMYHDQKVYQNSFKPNFQKEPTKAPRKTVRDDVPIYIYKPEHEEEFIEPESSKKIIPTVIAKKEVVKEPLKESVKEFANDNVKPDKLNDKPITIGLKPINHNKIIKDDDLDMPCAQLPFAPNLEKTFQPSETKEDVSPVIFIPATLRQNSPEKIKESPKKKKEKVLRKKVLKKKKLKKTTTQI